jgi:hypothetical protein
VECDLSNDAKVFIASRPVIACDPKEAVINNKLGEDHVGVSILYCLSDVSIVMIIWKWSFAQIFWMGAPLDNFSYFTMKATYQ